MSAQMVMASNVFAWRATDCLVDVEQRCEHLIGASGDGDTEHGNVAARAAAWHLRAGGRRIRALLALDAAHRLGLTARTAISLATTAELLHNASLIHDDLQDRDPQRRGVDAVWKMFGDEVALCAGDLLLSAAYVSLADVANPTWLSSMLTTVHTCTAAAIRGQAADVGHRNLPVADVDAYTRIVAGKSGALLSLPLELALLAAGHARWTATARKAAEAFAIGYQIADDLDDVDKDAGSDTIATSLNVVLLMQSHDAANDAARTLARDTQQNCAQRRDIRARCAALARRHLNGAIDGARLLPNGCGTLLMQLAVDLDARL